MHTAVVTAAPGHRPGSPDLGSVLKYKQLLQNRPRQAGSTVLVDFGQGWWLQGWACVWVRVVEFVIHQALPGSGRGGFRAVWGAAQEAAGLQPGTRDRDLLQACCTIWAGLSSLGLPSWKLRTITPALPGSGNFASLSADYYQP